MTYSADIKAAERGREQAALRRVATLVAGSAAPADLFAAVVGEAAQVLAVPTVMLARYEPDRAITVVASVNEPTFTVGSRWPLDGHSVSAAVLDSGRPARIDDYSTLPGTIAAAVRESPIRSTVGVPIGVDGAVWGVMTVATHESELLPADTEDRLSDFTDLIALAISNTESRNGISRLANEQAALRRVATLVAEGATTTELCAAVVKEVVDVLAVPAAWLLRYEPDRSMTVLAALNDPAFPTGSRWPLEGSSVTSRVFETGRPARIDDFADLPGPIAARTRESGFLSSLGVPITVDGSVWGAICVGTTEFKPLPADTESHLADFTELVATAISNAESREHLRGLAEEQAALHRVATLLAQGADASTVFDAVCAETCRLIDATSVNLSHYTADGFKETLARFSLSPDTVRAATVRTQAPVVVEGQLWGALVVATDREDPLPAGTESRLASFTGLVATAISNAAARDGLRALADEQAALHRVATLVAKAAPPEEAFAAVSEEVARLLGLPRVEMVRYESDGTATVIGASGDHPFPVGSRWSLDGPSVMESVFRTGRSSRIDDFTGLPGTAAEVARDAGLLAAIGSPIVVGGATWGAIIAIATTPEPIPEGSESRLSLFTDLVATAVSNVQARDDLRGLADEQAALRRVATLVAEGATADELFSAVATEVARVLRVSGALLERYERDGTAVTLAASRDAGWEAEIGVGAPIVVDGTPWGLIRVFSRLGTPLPDGTETRLGAFTELVATAVSNVEARDDLRGLADEQAALRRVATLVAEGATAEQLFSAVATEVAQVLQVSAALLDQYEPDGTTVTLAVENDPDWTDVADVFALGMRRPPTPGGLTATVHQTGRAARIDDYAAVADAIEEIARAAGIGSGCGSPIIVDGKLWGLIRVFSRQGTVLPAGTEARLDGFTELVATAVSNAAARAELIASRARIVAAGDEARRRIERNLHDGTQQRLIALGFDLQRVRAAVPGGRRAVHDGLGHMEEDLESVLADVRELSRGLHPPMLSRGGLQPTLRALARRSPIPVEIQIDLVERPPAPIETAVYYVVSEALTNAIRHSQATAISVIVTTQPGAGKLQTTIADDGVGGAEPTAGSGLTGLGDRIEALGGRFDLDSPPGRGTTISFLLPLG